MAARKGHRLCEKKIKLVQTADSKTSGDTKAKRQNKTARNTDNRRQADTAMYITSS